MKKQINNNNKTKIFIFTYAIIIFKILLKKDKNITLNKPKTNPIKYIKRNLKNKSNFIIIFVPFYLI